MLVPRAIFRRLLQGLHRYSWQRLPRAARRRILFFLAERLAPRPGPRPPHPSARIYVAGPLRTASGLGASARLSLTALCQAGYDAWGIDLSFKHDPKRQDFEFSEAANAEGAGTIILHVNGFLTPLALIQLGRRRIRHKMIVGYWAWELPELPDEWLPGFKFVHEIWTPSRFVAAAVARRTQLPVRVLHHPVQRPAMRQTIETAGAVPTKVLSVFDMASSFVRKNPLAAIAAFRGAFQDNPAWELVIKVSDADSYPSGRDALRAAVDSASNITLIEKILNPGEMDQLFASADIILSLHRSEGFGLVLAEAMQLGKVVVATNWSGNVDFMTAENSCPVRFTFVPAEDPQNTYDHPDLSWAEPDVSDAIRALTSLTDESRRQRLGRQAQKDAASLFSIEKYGRLVGAYLGEQQARNPSHECS